MSSWQGLTSLSLGDKVDYLNVVTEDAICGTDGRSGYRVQLG